jgi:hypothetical protein
LQAILNYISLQHKAVQETQILLWVVARLVTRYNMQMVFETARMYSGTVPALPLNKIFGVTSFELG